MFKRIILALVCVAAFSAATVATPDKADASWRYRRPWASSYYYGPSYGYYRPYRTYYRSYYRPRYYYDSYSYGYPYNSYYYGYPRYYSYGYPDYYYYGPRGGVSVSFGF
jgi:hypothetical protein